MLDLNYEGMLLGESAMFVRYSLQFIKGFFAETNVKFAWQIIL